MAASGIRISIITASYNSGTKLQETYRSIAGQDADFEYLIMDGGSTDGSLALAQSLADIDPRVVVHSEKDKGPYDAFNKGIEKSRGDYIYFLGAGDTLLPDVLKAVSARLPEQLKSFVYGDSILDGRRYDGKFTKRKLVNKNICHQSIFYGRDVFKICGLYNLKYRMIADFDFNQRCFGCSKIKKTYIPITVAVYEGGGLSTVPDPDYADGYFTHVRENMGRMIMVRLAFERFAFYMRCRFEQLLRKFKN